MTMLASILSMHFLGGTQEADPPLLSSGSACPLNFSVLELHSNEGKIPFSVWDTLNPSGPMH